METAPQLKDIHLPPAPDIWPLALIWWLLIALCLLLLLWLGWRLWRYRQKKHQQQQLLETFDKLKTQLERAPSNALIAQTNQLLRRLALRFFSERNVASLTGAQWLSFLDSTGETREFTRGAGRVLIEAPYQAEELKNYNGEEFINLVQAWVTKTVTTRS